MRSQNRVVTFFASATATEPRSQPIRCPATTMAPQFFSVAPHCERCLLAPAPGWAHSPHLTMHPTPAAALRIAPQPGGETLRSGTSTKTTYEEKKYEHTTLFIKAFVHK